MLKALNNIKKYHKHLVPDLLSGLTASIAYLSLGAALGIVSGRGAFAGIIASAIMSLFVAILGGTRRQLTVPTPTMAVPFASLVAFASDNFVDKYLFEQFLTLSIIFAGLWLIIAGLLNLGKYISLIPELIVYGFATGLAGLLWWNQIAKIFGIAGEKAFTGGIMLNFSSAIITLTLCLLLQKLLGILNIKEFYKAFFPASLTMIFLMTVIVTLLNLDIQKASLGSDIGSIAQLMTSLPTFVPNWKMITDFNIVSKAMYFGLQMSLIAYFDTLLTSVLIDNITKEKTNRKKELIAQGIGNIFSGLFGGIMGAQATIGSVLMIKEGMKTRVAGVFMSMFTFIGLFLLKDYISLIAMSVFTGILIKVGWDSLEKRYFEAYFAKNWFRDKSRNWQMFIVIFSALATVIIDLNVAVISGTIIFYILKRYKLVTDIKQKDIETEEGGCDTHKPTNNKGSLLQV